jgi:hypothetical protein
MRHILLASILALGAAGAASAQNRPPATPVPFSAAGVSAERVEITDGNFRAGMQPVAKPYTTGGPWAAIPAAPLKTGADPTVTEFRIRSWIEGDAARVLVFAASALGGWREAREQQIASLLVPLGQSVEVAATEKYRARRITLVTDRRAAQPYRLERHGIDIPSPIFAPRRR